MGPNSTLGGGVRRSVGQVREPSQAKINILFRRLEVGFRSARHPRNDGLCTPARMASTRRSGWLLHLGQGSLCILPRCQALCLNLLGILCFLRFLCFFRFLRFSVAFCCHSQVFGVILGIGKGQGLGLGQAKGLDQGHLGQGRGQNGMLKLKNSRKVAKKIRKGRIFSLRVRIEGVSALGAFFEAVFDIFQFSNFAKGC